MNGLHCDSFILFYSSKAESYSSWKSLFFVASVL